MGKKKVGGQPKPKHLKRSDTIRFRANEEERGILEAAAAKERLELSAWMRSVLLKRAAELQHED